MRRRRTLQEEGERRSGEVFEKRSKIFFRNFKVYGNQYQL